MIGKNVVRVIFLLIAASSLTATGNIGPRIFRSWQIVGSESLPNLLFSLRLTLRFNAEVCHFDFLDVRTALSILLP